MLGKLSIRQESHMVTWYHWWRTNNNVLQLDNLCQEKFKPYTVYDIPINSHPFEDPVLSLSSDLEQKMNLRQKSCTKGQATRV